MNLKNLFAAQKVLRDRIDYNEPDRFNKLILALLVELGECANEQRSWKYWSKDQKARTKVEHLCPTCEGSGDENWPSSKEMLLEGNDASEFSECEDCTGTGKLGETNPLLEEYVDGLHFVLEIGLEFGFEKTQPFLVQVKKPLDMFLEVYQTTAHLHLIKGRQGKSYYYGELLSKYLGLGKSLGFIWEQIEQAYYAKHAINLQRQDDGY